MTSGIIERKKEGKKRRQAKLEISCSKHKPSEEVHNKVLRKIEQFFKEKTANSTILNNQNND